MDIIYVKVYSYIYMENLINSIPIQNNGQPYTFVDGCKYVDVYGCTYVDTCTFICVNTYTNTFIYMYLNTLYIHDTRFYICFQKSLLHYNTILNNTEIIFNNLNAWSRIKFSNQEKFFYKLFNNVRKKTVSSRIKFRN